MWALGTDGMLPAGSESIATKSGPIEWRGRFQGGYFKPFAVIIRMPEMDAGSGSDLVVYRLRPDGASCIVGTTKSTNDAARSIADGSMGEFTCARQPQLP